MINVKPTTQFFLHWLFFINERCIIFSTISSADTKLLENTDSVLKESLLFGRGFQNFKIIITSIECISLTKRFDETLL